MGYTHYWSMSNDFTPAEWQLICGAARNVITKFNDFGNSVKLAREYDDISTPAEITDEHIRFNGLGDDGHETFLIPREIPEAPEWRQGEPDFQFCKTARKPYDDAVVAVLIYIRQECPGKFEWSSDGDLSEHDDGLKLLRSAGCTSLTVSNARND